MDWINTHNLIQAYLLVVSSLAVFLVARTDKWHKWGFIAGLYSEFGWVWGINPDQWGILFLVFWWTFYWAKGAWVRFK